MNGMWRWYLLCALLVFVSTWNFGCATADPCPYDPGCWESSGEGMDFADGGSR